MGNDGYKILIAQVMDMIVKGTNTVDKNKIANPAKKKLYDNIDSPFTIFSGNKALSIRKVAKNTVNQYIFALSEGMLVVIMN